MVCVIVNVTGILIISIFEVVTGLPVLRKLRKLPIDSSNLLDPN